MEVGNPGAISHSLSLKRSFVCRIVQLLVQSNFNRHFEGSQNKDVTLLATFNYLKEIPKLISDHILQVINIANLKYFEAGKIALELGNMTTAKNVDKSEASKIFHDWMIKLHQGQVW